MNTLPASIQSFLNSSYELTPDQINFYQKNRYIKLKQVLNKETLEFYNREITDQVEKMNTGNIKMYERTTYGKAFLQLFNLWRERDSIKSLVLSKRLGEIAASLMQCNGARIYHDQALFKEPGGGITPWHADQFYWPLATDKTVTVWMPLQETSLDMGPLEFSAGSHTIVEGRELAISDESEIKIEQNLKVIDFKHIVEPFELGEVSFHSGWVFHRAGANQTGQMRKVMTIIYMDKDMILKNPENDNQVHDWNTWCPGAIIGETINTEINPVVFP